MKTLSVNFFQLRLMGNNVNGILRWNTLLEQMEPKLRAAFRFRPEFAKWAQDRLESAKSKYLNDHVDAKVRAKRPRKSGGVKKAEEANSKTERRETQKKATKKKKKTTTKAKPQVEFIGIHLR